MHLACHTPFGLGKGRLLGTVKCLFTLIQWGLGWLLTGTDWSCDDSLPTLLAYSFFHEVHSWVIVLPTLKQFDFIEVLEGRSLLHLIQLLQNEFAFLSLGVCIYFRIKFLTPHQRREEGLLHALAFQGIF